MILKFPEQKRGFFEIRPGGPWGDYGVILAHGFVAEPFRTNERLVLHRCGPFVPPLTVPSYGSLVCTSLLRQQLEQQFSAVEFREVIIDKAVEINWHTWDS